MKKPSISVFFPCYNDSHTIGGLIDDAVNTVRNLTDRFEVIVVEDGSSDGSQEVLKSLEKKYPQVFRPVYHPKNRGYGGALKSGFKKARYDLVFYTDGDAQYDIGEL